MKKINLNSVAFLVLGVFLLLTPALSQAIITSLVTAFFRNIDLLVWVNLAQSFWILNLVPKVVGAALVAGFVWKHLKTRFKVDLPKIKVQTTRLATYSLLFMLCAGLFLFADVPVSEAATTATTGYILDTPVSEHAWLIGAYSDGTYYAIEGSTWDNKVAGVGSTAWASYKTNSTKITELVLDSTTSGSIYMKDVAFDMDLFDDIPEDVRVICSYNAEYWEYINSADSSGSPYTVSVGSGVNAGYYLAQDSGDRICFASTNASYVINSVISAQNLKVNLAAGTFILTSPLLFSESNIQLKGVGDSSVLRLDTAGDIAIKITSQNVTVSNLQIYATVIDSSEYPDEVQLINAQNCKLDNIHFLKSEYRPLVVSYSDNVEIENCYFEHTGYGNPTVIFGTAISIQDSTNVRILNNRIESPSGSGIIIYNNDTSNPTENVEILGNIISQSHNDNGIYVSTTDSGEVSNVVISNNIVYGCLDEGGQGKGSGISVRTGNTQTATYGSKNVVVSDNIVYDCVKGINFWDSQGIIVSTNTIYNVTEFGISDTYQTGNKQSQFVIIDGNTIINSGYRGLHLNNISYATISNNVVNGTLTYEGLRTETTCTNLVIQGNHFYNTYLNAIRIYSPNTIISENLINGTIAASDSSGISVRGSNSIISGNIIQNIPNEYGVQIYSASNCSISDNQISDIGLDGIYLTTAQFDTIKNNKILRTYGGIFVTNASDITINGNDIITTTTKEGVRIENSCSDILIEANKISGTYLNPIRCYAPYTVINDNTISDITTNSADATGISVRGAHSIISNNFISNIDYADGIQVFTATNCSITGNYIYDIAVYAVRSQTAGNFITGNFIQNCVNGIELSVAGNVVTNNNLAQITTETIHTTAGTQVIKNNIINGSFCTNGTTPDA